MKNIILILLMTVVGLNAQVTGLSGWNLFVDPGHSQHENMGVSGYSEAEEALGTALNLRQILLSQTDIDTVWSSRYNNNVLVSLYERTQDANNRGAAWYHSVHSNAGAPEHNNVLLLWGELYDGTPDPPVGGETMANIMINRLSSAMRLPSIGSHGDCSFYSYSGACTSSWPGPYLYVNRNTNMPSELSEQGYHTNPLQNQLDMNPQYKRMLAYSMFWTILDKFGIEHPFPGILAGIITDSETGIRVNGASVTINGQTYITDTYASLFNQYTSDPEAMHNGFYFFEGLPDSSFEVVVNATGYYPDTLAVDHLSADFITFLDLVLIPNTPPVVVASEPVAGDTSFTAWDRLHINFSRAMDTESLETAFSMTPPVDGVFHFTQGDKRLIFDPIDTLAALTYYTVTIAASATDLGGHPLDGNADGIGGDPWSMTFRTALLDTFPPLLVQTYPASGAVNVPGQPVINLIWDEVLLPSSFSAATIKLERIADLQVQNTYLEHRLVNESSIISLYCLDELQGAENYQIHILPGVKDILGNQIEQDIYVNFTTGTTGYSPSLIDGFESSPLSNWWEIQSSGSNLGILTDLTQRGSSADPTVISEGSNSSLWINYGWNTTANAWLIREYLDSNAPPRNVHFTADHLMQVWVFGDGAGNKFRFCVDDNIGNVSGTEVSPWYTIDWIGWQLVTWDMAAEGTGIWIGDGNLDGTLEFDSIQLSYTPGQPAIGRIYLDNLRIADQTLLSVDNQISQQPRHLALLPNYPNPFNPWTSIPFTLPEQAKVQITIYNLKGEQIARPFSGSLPAGRHLTRWNAARIPSGIYLVRMVANARSVTRKLTVLK